MNLTAEVSSSNGRNYRLTPQMIYIGFLCFCLITLSPMLLADPPRYNVAGWGDNVFGESTGIPSNGYAAGLVTIGGGLLNSPKAVAAGAYHSLALLADGSVIGWGRNGSGEAVGESSKPSGGYVMINGVQLTNAKSIAACDNYSLAVTGEGRVVGWGNVTVPPSVTNVAAVSAGASHCLALRADGTVISWRAGYPPMGLEGRDTSAERLRHDFTIMSNRIVANLGPSIVTNKGFWVALSASQPKPPLYSALSNVVAIAACRWTEGDDLALRSDGTVVEWPFRNREDRLTAPAGLSNVTAIASGGAHCLALKSDGVVVGWGENDAGQANVPAGLSNVVAISADRGNSMALKSDGTITVWGVLRQTEIPAGLGTVVAIAAGGQYCLTIQTSSNLGETNANATARK